MPLQIKKKFPFSFNSCCSSKPKGHIGMSGFGGFLLRFLLLFFAISLNAHQARSVHVQGLVQNGSEAAEMKMVPLIEPGKFGPVVLNETRRRLGSFRICALCTCCGGPKGLCLPSPCCYAINCNIPNRPFGFCSFTPKTCNCFGCHL